MNDKTRAAAVQHELNELAKLSKTFDLVVQDAICLAADLRDAADRMRLTLLGDKIDKQIDELDYKMKRGKYLNLRDNVISIADAAIAEGKRLRGITE